MQKRKHSRSRGVRMKCRDISRNDSVAGDAPGPSVPYIKVSARLAAMENMVARMKGRWKWRCRGQPQDLFTLRKAAIWA